MSNSYSAKIVPHVFKEHPVKNHLAENYDEFDITGKHADTIDFINRGKFSDLAYCKALIAKFAELSKSQFKEFVEYQLSLVIDKKRWVTDLEKFTELNIELINLKQTGLVEHISKIIDGYLNQAVDNISIENKLHWNGNDTDLLELVVALTQTGIITNKVGKSPRTEVLSVFEGLFGITVKESEKKLEAAAKRKRDKAPFLKSLVLAFEKYTNRYENK